MPLRTWDPEELEALIYLIKKGANFIGPDGDPLVEEASLQRLLLLNPSMHLGGLIRQAPDSRDIPANVPPTPKGLVEVDLRKFASPAEQQGALGSCFAAASVSDVELQSVKNTKSFKDKSKLYLFYNTHDMSGTLGNDCGATLRATLSALQKFGVCDESLWPYNIAKCWVKPSQACYDQAKAFTIKSYKYLPSGDVSFAKGMIAAGYPIVFGADVFSSLMSPMISITSVLRMPDSGEKTQGGHCMCVVGASDSKKMFLIKNSWGAEWTPIGGYFWMPYRYWEEFTWDPWVVVL